MKFQECLIVLFLNALGLISTQSYVQADEEQDEPLLFFKDDEIEELDPIFEEEASANICREPEIPLNGELLCGKISKTPDSYVCKAQCFLGFEFPNKAKKGKIVCNLKTGVWMPRHEFSACEKEVICNPSCKNGGKCRAENVCDCPARYNGERCEQDKCHNPPTPSNAKMFCKKSEELPNRYVCRTECVAGFQFSNEEKQKSHFCDLKTGEWMPKHEFPDCERICVPPCQNSGTCMEGNTCFCTSHYKGDSCEIDICQQPPTPLNGKISCAKLVNNPNSFMCIAECQAEYQFSDGEKKGKHICDYSTGKWAPKYQFEDCKPSCNPSCQNEGECVEGNRCICPKQFEGDRCQNAKCNPPCQNGGICTEGNICTCMAQFGGNRCEQDKCRKPPHPLNGKLSCENHLQNPDRYLCEAKCDEGYQFPNAEETKSHLCDLYTGEWKPKHEFPDCEPICNPPCENGGQCIEGNICICVLPFNGEQCQYGLCKDPAPPLNGNLTCGKDENSLDRYMCIAECHSNYYFPNKWKKERHFCDMNTGAWTKHEFPDCEPICNPSCQNGGICTKGNTCICAPPFNGERCQHDSCKESPPPLNGNLACRKLVNPPNSYLCQAECDKGYQFPNEDIKGSQICDMITGEWKPKYGFPDCEPICKPSCQNGGQCTEGNQCICTPEFEGYRCQNGKCNPHCQNGGQCIEGNICICTPQFRGERCEHGDSDQCKDPPPPLNGNITCGKVSNTPGSRYLCTAECQTNYFFPNKWKKQRHFCDLNTGAWEPTFEFPDCERICNPSCQNGGKCTDGNTCICPPQFKGVRCQYATPVHVCVPGWTEYFNTDHPDFSEIGDDESLNRIRARHDFCIGGTIEDIQCKAVVDRHLLDYEDVGLFGLKCSKNFGFECNKYIRQKKCEDFAVRFFCSCGAEEKPTPLKMCPEIPDSFQNNCPKSCAKGLSCNGTACIPSDHCSCFKNGLRFKQSNAKVITKDCQRCECITGGHSKCEPVKCPRCLPNERSVVDSNCRCSCVGCPLGTVLCPRNGLCLNEDMVCNGIDCPELEMDCPPAPPKDIRKIPSLCSTDRKPDTNTCEMLGNVIETFDGFSYQYEVCDHVLMKESISELYSVTVYKTCSSKSLEVCARHLDINVDGTIIKLGSGTSVVTVKNTRVAVSNLWLVSKRFPDFELKENGNKLVFRSFKYNFDVTWDKLGYAMITVSKCLMNNIVGLCGLYNRNSQDDLRMPNGSLTPKKEEFGTSWAIGSLENCRLPNYSPRISRRTAVEVCVNLKKEPFNSSCAEYININNRVDACVASMRDCMQRADGYRTTSSRKDDSSEVVQCKCQIYESFVEACQTAKQGRVGEWRILNDCSSMCPKGMEWQDCGPGCQLTCDNYHQRSKICSETCISGCYCPSGLVRHQNQCVKPKMCQDCICRGHGDPNYVTFDGRYYAFQGNCTYVLAQHQTSKDAAMNFRVLAIHIECPDEPHTTCIEGLKIIWNGHIVEKLRNKPVYMNRMLLSIGDSHFDDKGISITYVQNRSTLIHIEDINLVVRYFDEMFGFKVELPSFFYYNQTEGLCGVCNFNQSDDMYHREGYITNDVKEFAFSWLEAPETRRNCELPPKNLPEPPPGICNFTASSCEAIFDPSVYSKSCLNDVKYSRKFEASMCRSKLQYAQQCCERGVAMDEWLELNGCESQCPEGMVYKCTSACPKTCENIKTYREDDCSLMPVYTCGCPENEVLKLGKCVKAIQCEVCDSRGHSVGDVWQDGSCKTCECLPDLSISCTVQQCPESPLCDAHERLLTLNRQVNGCCQSYKCVPKSDRVCPESKFEACPPGKAYVKYSTTGCPTYRCECFPELCPPVVIPFLDDGENFTLVTTDCCPEVKSTCNPNMCPPTPNCSPGFKTSLQRGQCCIKYACVPQKKVCLYQHKYHVVNGTQVDLPLEDYYDLEYEVGSSWQDGLCRSCSCFEINGHLMHSCTAQVCPNPFKIPEAKKYITEFPIPGSCCPKYIRTACLDEGIKYEIGELWTVSVNNSCKKSSRCIRNPKGEAVKEVTTTCERNCQEGSIATDSDLCKERCKAFDDTCSAANVSLNDTKGFFGYIDEKRGKCSNKELIYGLKKCSGQCPTKSQNAVLIEHFQDVSNCCTPWETQNRAIVLECEDGTRVVKKYIQPLTCRCLSCSRSNHHQVETD